MVLGACIASVVALAAVLARVGSDAQWLAALGHVIVVSHRVPAGLPFAVAPTSHWPNSLVLAELIFEGLEWGFGDRGLMLGQLLAVTGALLLLARDARNGGADAFGTSGALLLAALGCLQALAIARVQMFSLVLFPAIVLLLRAQTRAPSRRLWLTVPLLALWSNLHGGALLGLGVVLAYLVFERGRREPWLAVGVGAASILALSLTPALGRTAAYYAGLMSNAAAQRGQGLWGPLSLSSPFDLLLLATAILLGTRMWRGRASLWEWSVVAALALLTVHADRNGVWLLFFLVAPAARALAPVRSLQRLVPIAGVAGAAVIAVALARGPVPTGASGSLVDSAVALAHGSPVLADGTIDEQVALAGGRIWAGDPIDAFSHNVQNAYLDWISGDRDGASALAPAVHVVLVSRGTQTQELMARMPGFVAAQTSGDAVMYEREVTG